MEGMMEHEKLTGQRSGSGSPRPGCCRVILLWVDGWSG